MFFKGREVCVSVCVSVCVRLFKHVKAVLLADLGNYVHMFMILEDLGREVYLSRVGLRINDL